VVFPEQIHRCEISGKASYQLFLIQPESIPELASTLESKVPTSAVLSAAANEKRIEMLLDVLTETCEGSSFEPYRGTLLRGYLLAFVSELLSRMDVESVSKSDSDSLRSIVSFCSENYSQDLSLTVLEENLKLNKYYISHLFSDKLGLRFNDYINSLRIYEACRMLVNSDRSMNAISDMVGFNTLRTFNRAFMKQMKVSPSDYRRIYRKKLD